MYRYDKRTDVLHCRHQAERGDMKSAIKIPLQVSPEQAVLLDSQSKIANWLYNKLLETANDLRQQYRAAPDQEHRNQIGLVLYTERGLRDSVGECKQYWNGTMQGKSRQREYR